MDDGIDPPHRFLNIHGVGDVSGNALKRLIFCVTCKAANYKSIPGCMCMYEMYIAYLDSTITRYLFVVWIPKGYCGVCDIPEVLRGETKLPRWVSHTETVCLFGICRCFIFNPRKKSKTAF